ncbi:MAG: PorT family protein [Chlorobi bacterium]|nr:PorT family protein [Chlorobiota bacterium]
MRKITIILLFFLSANNLLAQEDNAFIPEHLIGFTGGINMVSVFSEDKLTYTDRSGNFLVSSPYIFKYSGGLSYKYISQKNVGLLAELTYTQKGGYNEFMFDKNGNVTDSILFNHQLDYGEFAFLTDIRLGKKHSKINIYIGPHIAYLLKQKLTILEDTYGKEYVNGTNIKFEAGIDIGGGYSFHFNKGEVELRFIYNHDFTNIFPGKSINNFSFNQNQVYSFNLSYYYKLSKKKNKNVKNNKFKSRS